MCTSARKSLKRGLCLKKVKNRCEKERELTANPCSKGNGTRKAKLFYLLNSTALGVPNSEPTIN